ncbi:MAG TPA: ABC transporter ATP-binding protein [Solirubrobacteraceae bacterium]|jgi:oligopeptide/dipeptide ABC transporter ATP-binding protein
MTDGERLLEVRDVAVSLGRGRAAAEILRDVSLHVGAGEIVGLIGETGSGKTTLARTILGINAPTAGTVRVAGTTVSALRGSELRAFRRSGAVQFVFQDPLRSLDPDLRVGAIVAEGLAIRGDLGVAELDARAREALEQVGLEAGMADRHPAQLSGGQRQRVAIARALAGGPRLLVCDEPVSALDASSRNQILRLLDDLRGRLGIGILVISHDLSSLAAIADRIAVLYRGRVLEDGPTGSVLGVPSHPYSALLVASAPSVADHAGPAPQTLRRPASDPPAPAGAGACVYAARCPFATSACATAPQPAPVGRSWEVACHHAGSWRRELAERRKYPTPVDLPRPLAGATR